MSKLRRVTTLPRQSLVAMKVAFGFRAQYATLAMLGLLMLTQVAGVIVFTGKARAAGAHTVTTGSADLYGPNGEYTTLNGTFTPSDDVQDSGFEYGPTTSYGNQVDVPTYMPFHYQQVAAWGQQASDSETINGGESRIAVDSNENSYVLRSSTTATSVLKYNASHTLLATWEGIKTGGLAEARDITLDQDGNILVLFGNGVKKYDSDGNFLLQWGVSGIGSGELTSARAIKVDAGGNVYILDKGPSLARLYKFDATGSLLDANYTSDRIISDQYNYASLAVAPSGSIYVSWSYPVYMIDIYDTNLDRTTTWSDFGPPGDTWRPSLVSIAQNGKVYIAGGPSTNVPSTVKQYSSGAISYDDEVGTAGSGSIMGLDVNSSSDSIYISSSRLTGLSKWNPGIRAGYFSGGGILNNVTCGNTYHYRAYVTDSVGTSYGADQTFTTPDCPQPPTVTTHSALYDYEGYFTQHYRRFNLRGTYIPAANVIEKGFEYGTTTDYGQQITDDSTGGNYSESKRWDERITGDTSRWYGEIVADSEGNSYVSAFDGYNVNAVIQKFSQDGDFLMEWDYDGGAIVIDPDDNILVLANRQLGDPTPVVKKYSNTGTYLGGWGSMGFSNGQFWDATGITVDASGDVYISQNTPTNRIQKFHADGTYVLSFDNPPQAASNPRVQAASTYSGNVYVIAGNGVELYSSDGQYQETYTNFDTEYTGQFPLTPVSLALDSSNNIYISFGDTANVNYDYIRKYDASFNPVSAWKGNYPFDITVNKQQNTLYAIGSYGYDSELQIDGVTVFAPSIDVKFTATCGTTYHYRAFVTTDAGTGYGEDQVFTSFNCPVIDTVALADGKEGDSYTQQIDVTHDANYYPSQTTTYSVLLGSLPEGLSLDATTGIISGTPSSSAAGTYLLTIGAEDWLGSTSKTFALTVEDTPGVVTPVDPPVDGPVRENPIPDLSPEQPSITNIVQDQPGAPSRSAKTSPLKTPQVLVGTQNSLLALAKRIPEPFAISFPWLLLLLALILVSIQYYQVHAEAVSTRRIQENVANQERLVDEQNNFVALSTHYLHTPLTVMEGEISLMVKAGTITEVQATKLKATLTSLNAEAEAVLAQEEQNV